MYNDFNIVTLFIPQVRNEGRPGGSAPVAADRSVSVTPTGQKYIEFYRAYRLS